MTTRPRLSKRLRNILEGLTPEEKARLVIESGFKPKPSITSEEERAMLNSLTGEEGPRYNAYLDRYYRAREVMLVLGVMCGQTERALLERDRLLWYLYGLDLLVDRITFDGKPLLENNPSLKPGEPLEWRLLFATVRLGVWGKKRQPFPQGKNADVPLVEVSEPALEILDTYGERIRALAADVKALHEHLMEEAEALELPDLANFVQHDVDRVKEHDGAGAIIPGLLPSVAIMTGRGTHIDREKEGLPHVVNPWELVWDDVEANPETLRRARESRDGNLVPASLDTPFDAPDVHFDETIVSQNG